MKKIFLKYLSCAASLAFVITAITANSTCVCIIHLLNLFTIVTLGLIYGMLKEVSVFTLAYVPLRSYAGGFHAKTHMKCYVCSILIINAVLLIIKFSMFSETVCYIIAFLSSIVIFFFSPVEDGGLYKKINIICNSDSAQFSNAA